MSRSKPAKAAAPASAATAASERLVVLSRSRREDREVTIYVKGFLGRGEQPDHFGPWLASHREIASSRGWGPRAYGYSWQSGRVGVVAAPTATAAKLAWELYQGLSRARRVALVGALGFAAAEQIARLAIRLARQYVAASRAASSRAEHLADRLGRLTADYRHVRVVGHSLGCLLLIEAVDRMPPQSRPHQVHLCAPACRERDVAEKLRDLARGSAYLYFTRSDMVLATAFRLMAWGHALGAAGPREAYTGLEAIDVGDHFGVRVHGDYKNRFPKFAAG